MSVRTKPNREGEAPVEAERDEGELPEGWATTSLIDLLTSLESGSRPRGGVRGIADGVPSIGGEHLNYDGTFNFESIKFVPHDFATAMTKGRIRENDVLIVKDGATTGKTAFVGSDFPHPEAFVNEHVFICRPTDKIEARFLFRFLMSKDGEDRILENFKGSAQGGINQTFAPNVQVPLAPLAEQRRIVGKLELLLGKVSSSQQRLSRVPGLLKRFRQSVLAAACSGKLTADWREANEPQSAASRWSLTAEPLNSDQLPDLPPTWVWRKIDDISERVSVGHVGPTSQFYCGSDVGIPFVRSQNVRPARLMMDDSQYITHEFHNSLKKSQLRAGDILIVRVGANRGDTCKVPEDIGVLNCANIVFARPFPGISDFIAHYCQSKLGQDLLLGMTTGSAQGVLNTTAVAELPIPIPPLSEQKEIVRRVEKLFAFADQIESRLRQAQAHVDRLTQSLLAKAFRGELVPTEHALATRESRAYETAAALLGRIRTAHDQASNSDGPKQMRSRRKN